MHLFQRTEVVTKIYCIGASTHHKTIMEKVKETAELLTTTGTI